MSKLDCCQLIVRLICERGDGEDAVVIAVVAVTTTATTTFMFYYCMLLARSHLLNYSQMLIKGHNSHGRLGLLVLPPSEWRDIQEPLGVIPEAQPWS